MFQPLQISPTFDLTGISVAYASCFYLDSEFPLLLGLVEILEISFDASSLFYSFSIEVADSSSPLIVDVGLVVVGL